MNKTNIEQSFEDRKSTYLYGLLGWVYWIYHMTAANTSMRVLPDADGLVIGLLFAVILTLQIFVWRFFRHFQKGWYLKPRAYIFFLSEFGILTFTAAFMLWPFFIAFKSKLI